MHTGTKSARKLAQSALIVLAITAEGIAVTGEEIATALEQRCKTHPRLFLDDNDERKLVQRIASNPILRKVESEILVETDRILGTEPVERVLTGRRLLDKSRTALFRVIHLGVGWWLAGKSAYLERARAELIKVAAFPDWNPSHFLDVAEMTTAVALGYDWFYPALDELRPEQSCRLIVQFTLTGSAQPTEIVPLERW